MCHGSMTGERGNTRWVCAACGIRLSYGLAELLDALSDRPSEPLTTTLEALRLLGFSVSQPGDHLKIALPQYNETWEFTDQLPATSEELRDMLREPAQQHTASSQSIGPVPPEERIYCPKCHAAASKQERTCQWCGTALPA